MFFKSRAGMAMAMLLAFMFTVDAQLRQSGIAPSSRKTVCVYNSTSFIREGMFTLFFLFLIEIRFKSRVLIQFNFARCNSLCLLLSFVLSFNINRI